MSSQPPPKPPATSSRAPPDLTSEDRTQELINREKLTRSVVLTLLQDTYWPTQSEDAAQKLIQAINNLPDLRDVAPVKDTVEELIRVLGTAHAILKEASGRYGRKQGGIRDGIKHAIPSRRRGKWTDTLRTCRADVEKISTRIRSRLENTAPTDSFPNVSEDQENPSPIRDRVLTAAKRTFKTVDAVSGTIPVVGSYVGAAAKLGLTFVGMIETMDRNEDVAMELASHTSKLSEYLEHIKKKSDAGHGDDLAAHIDGLHGEFETIQKKISGWSSLPRFKKVLSASEHAGKLKGHQDTVQTALEEMQLLVSLKTSDLVIELQNTELRAERRRLLDRLGDGSYGARGNSIEDVVCLPGTRVEILDRIDEWIKDTSASAERVLWIRGMAGQGKSTIASTVAHSWASRGSCAIFHFRRGQNAADGQFICALARQLGKGLVPEVKDAILACVKENEDIAKERLAQQFKTLFVGSLGRLQDHAHPIIIIVDALDECENVVNAVDFVRLIDQHSSFLPTNVRFLLTCRPEAPLLVALEPRKWHAEDLGSISHVSEDITMYLRRSFAQIRVDHAVPGDWPSSADVERMVEMSQGLFQWARTAVTYVGERSPVRRLQELLKHSSKWGKLDYLYRQILSKAFDEAAENSMRRQLLSWVLETLVVAPYPVSLEVIVFLHADHEIFEDQADNVEFLRGDILADLNSLLHIPSSPCEPLRLMHTSIRDLLESRERCENQHYFVDLVQAHRRLANATLRIMGRDLKKNICELSNLSKANSEVQDAVDSHVTKGLRYCCRSWSIHLTAGVSWSEANGVAPSDIWSNFRMVSKEKLLAWLEVMSLMGATNEAFRVAKQVHQWLEQWPPETSSGDLITLWNDTQRFIASSVEPISFGALHIYASALPHCPVETELWATYGGGAATRILCGERQITWPATIWTSSLNTIAWRIVFSPDGGILACGLNDGTVRLLDAQTGAQLGDPLTGHTEESSSVVFSPDGKVLASGSRDNTVRLWDVRTGAQLGEPLTGHTGWLCPVIFSPDGKILASGSRDNTVRLWDARTGAQLGNPLTGHTDGISSVVFSPDGKVLASGSDDKTVRLWDARTGAQVGDPLTGHTGWICSVIFSSDGKVLASGSWDSTVRLWDAWTGTQLGDPLTGHTSSITSVVFSPDGKVLASGSRDNTVRLWDAWTGAQVGEPLTGHTGQVNSVVFSPDGKVLASVSSDSTVRLWDARTGAQLGNPLTGHTNSITSVVFSPDGKVLASGSYDNTVRLWDARTGAQLGNPPTGHTHEIRSVVFSPDGKVLASGSDDKTVRLWDARTGAQVGDPLTGHTDWLYPVIFSPDGKALASMLDDNTVRLWDARIATQLGEPLTGHTNSITSVVFSPDGEVLASGSRDKTVRLWDARTGAQVGEPLTGHTHEISSVVFSPDGKVLASVSRDKTVRLWDARTGAQVGEPLTVHMHEISSVVFSPNGKVLASRSYGNTVRLWDARTGAQLGGPLKGHAEWISSVVFSPDGKVLASVSHDNTVRLWDTQTGAQLGNPLTGHTDEIWSVIFSPDGKVLASGSDDKTVRLWDARTGAQLGEPLTGNTHEISFSPDDKVLARSANGTFRLCDPLTWQTFVGSSKSFTARHISLQSNWILCDSNRFLWLPVHYQRLSEYLRPKILFSHGRLAFFYMTLLLLIDISEFSDSLSIVQ